jgi:hypothetical protein
MTQERFTGMDGALLREHSGSGPCIELMRSIGQRVLETDISKFVMDCGGIHCLVQELTRDSGR